MLNIHSGDGVLLFLVFHGRGGGMSRPRLTPERTTCFEGRISCWSWWRCMPSWWMDRDEGDAALSHHILCSVDTPKAVVV